MALTEQQLKAYVLKKYGPKSTWDEPTRQKVLKGFAKWKESQVETQQPPLQVNIEPPPPGQLASGAVMQGMVPEGTAVQPQEIGGEVTSEQNAQLGRDIYRGTVGQVTGEAFHTPTYLKTPSVWELQGTQDNSWWEDIKNNIGAGISGYNEEAMIFAANKDIDMNDPQQAKTDEKGNWYFNVDGQWGKMPREPSVSDAVGAVAMMTPWGKVAKVAKLAPKVKPWLSAMFLKPTTTALGTGAREAAIQTGIEGVQAGLGGEVNALDIGMAAGMGSGLKALGQVGNAASKGPEYSDVFRRAYAGDEQAIIRAKEIAKADPQMAEEVAQELQLQLDPTVGVRDRTLSKVARDFVQGKASADDLRRNIKKNPETIKALEELGIKEFAGARQLTDVNDFETKKLFDAIYGTVKEGGAGQELHKREKVGLGRITESIIDKLDSLRGDTDLVNVSDKVKDLIAIRRNRISDIENGAYSAVRKYVPDDAEASTDATMSYLEEVLESRRGATSVPDGYVQVEGKKGGYLSPLENRVYQSLKDKVFKLKPGQSRLKDDLTTKPSEFVQKAQYQNVDSLRKIVGRSLKSAQGSDLGDAKKLYATLTQDQDASIAKIAGEGKLGKEAQKKWAQAKRAHKTGMALDEDFKKLFSSKLSDFIESEGIISGKDLTKPLQRSTKGMATKAPAEFIKMVNALPGGVRREVVSSALIDQAKSVESTTFNGFAKFWSGIQKSKKLTNFLKDPRNLDPLEYKLLDSLGKTSKAITESMKIDPNNPNLENMLNSKGELLQKMKEWPVLGAMTGTTLFLTDIIGKAFGAKGGQSSVAMNIVALGAMRDAYDSLKGKHVETMLEAINSDAMMDFLRNPNITEASVEKLAQSTPIKNFFRKMQMPDETDAVEQFLLRALRADRQTDPQPQED